MKISPIVTVSLPHSPLQIKCPCSVGCSSWLQSLLLTVLSVAAVTGTRGISNRIPLFGMDAASEQAERELQQSRVASHRAWEMAEESESTE